LFIYLIVCEQIRSSASSAFNLHISFLKLCSCRSFWCSPFSIGSLVTVVYALWT